MKVIRMRPAILTSLLLAACAAPAAVPIPQGAIALPVPTPHQVTAPAPPTGGGEAWMGTRWGMSKAEVRAAVQQAVDWTQKYGSGGPGKEFAMFGVQKFPLEGACYVQVDFRFKDGGLSFVELSVRSDTLEIGEDLKCYGIVERGLTGRYGRAAKTETRKNGSAVTHFIDWVTPSSQIGMSQIDVPVWRNPDGTTVVSYMTSIVYQPRVAAIEGKF